MSVHVDAGFDVGVTLSSSEYVKRGFRYDAATKSYDKIDDHKELSNNAKSDVAIEPKAGTVTLRLLPELSFGLLGEIKIKSFKIGQTLSLTANLDLQAALTVTVGSPSLPALSAGDLAPIPRAGIDTEERCAQPHLVEADITAALGAGLKLVATGIVEENVDLIPEAELFRLDLFRGCYGHLTTTPRSTQATTAPTTTPPDTTSPETFPETAQETTPDEEW